MVTLTEGQESVPQVEVKLNCWEHKKCGRQPGGHRVQELGVCPAATNTELHGAHGGTNWEGRAGSWQGLSAAAKSRERMRRSC